MHKETSSCLGISCMLSVEACGASTPVEDSSCDQEEVVVLETSPVPLVAVEMAQLPPSVDHSHRALDESRGEEGPKPRVSECSGRIIGSSPASYFKTDGPRVIRCFQVAS